MDTCRLAVRRLARMVALVDWKSSAEVELEVASLLAQLEPDLRTAERESDPAGDWLCAWCHHRVANERDRFPIGGTDEFDFANPAGLRFQIITFSEALGCRETGLPTLEHTWFPGHAWSYCLCSECGQHLGWFFAGPGSFVGLIKNRIVRALYLRN